MTGAVRARLRRPRPWRAGSWRARGWLGVALLLAACAGSGEGAAGAAPNAAPDSAALEASEEAPEEAPMDRAGRGAEARPAPRVPDALHLAGAVPDGRYVVAPVREGGVVEGRVIAGGGVRGMVRGMVRELVRGVARDTSIVPTHDLAVCRPFTETRIPGREGGVGEAVVWLAGVRTGPADTGSMRPRLELDGCRLYPRVQRVRQGSTLQVASRDAMASQLRFTADGAPGGMMGGMSDGSTGQGGALSPLALVSFTDAGQVVPVEGVTRTPGVVRVRDDRHPWVMAVLAVAPHPWVAVTEPDGAFRFADVPPGEYTLVVWQEALGTRTQPLRVEPGVTVRLTMGF